VSPAIYEHFVDETAAQALKDLHRIAIVGLVVRYQDLLVLSMVGARLRTSSTSIILVALTLGSPTFE